MATPGVPKAFTNSEICMHDFNGCGALCCKIQSKSIFFPRVFRVFRSFGCGSLITFCMVDLMLCLHHKTVCRWGTKKNRVENWLSKPFSQLTMDCMHQCKSAQVLFKCNSNTLENFCTTLSHNLYVFALYFNHIVRFYDDKLSILNQQTLSSLSH